MKIRRLICGLAATALVATGLAAATAPTSAASGSLLYDCTWNNGTASGVASAVIDTDLPATLVVGQQVPVTLTEAVTLPAVLSDQIRLVPTATSYDGTGVADTYVNGGIRQASMTIPRTPIPGSGPITVVGTGPVAPLGSAVPTTLEVTAGNFTLHLQLNDANGVPIALAHTDVACMLQAGQNLHVDTVTVTPVPTTTTVTIQNGPLQYGDQAGVTADMTTTGSNVKPDGSVVFSVDGKSVKAAVKAGKAKATLPSSLTLGPRTVTAVFTPTDTNLGTSQGSAVLKVVKADSITSVSANYRPAKDKLVARGKVVAAYETGVDGSVKYILRRDGVRIRTKTVTLNKRDVARAAFGGITRNGKYTVVARYLGSQTLRRSVDRFKLVI